MRLGPAVAVMILAAGAAPTFAAVVPQCCACIVGNVPAGQPLHPLFCGYVTAESIDSFESRCDANQGVDVPCFPAVPNQTCNETLAANGTTCPPASAAPAAHTWGLGGLFLALTWLGVAMRRRAR